MAESAADEVAVAPQRLDVGRPQEDPQEAGRERHPGRDGGAQGAGPQRVEAARVAEGGEKAHELQHHDERAGRGLGHAQAVEHLVGLHPAEGIHRHLGRIGQHRVGAAEGDDRGLAEEGRDAGSRRRPAPWSQRIRAKGADQTSSQATATRTARRPKAGCGSTRRRPAFGRPPVSSQGSAFFPPCPALPEKMSGRDPSAGVADDGRRQHDGGEGDVEEEDPDERQRRQRHHGPVFERPLADADDGLDHHREHGRLQAEEERTAPGAPPDSPRRARSAPRWRAPPGRTKSVPATMPPRCGAAASRCRSPAAGPRGRAAACSS